jgi:hypothetical protein
MMTTPPTAAEVDTYMFSVANMGAMLGDKYGYDDANLSLAAAVLGALGKDAVIWVVAYTDNSSNPHYELLEQDNTGVVGATDEQIEESSFVTYNFPFTGSPGIGTSQSIAYVNAIVEAYGAVTIRGYLVPGFAASFSPVDDTVQTWINDTANWAAAG